MEKRVKIGIIVLLIVSMIGIGMFSGSAIASTSGDEHRTSNSKQLGDENGQSFSEPERQRSEDRTRMEDR